MPITPSESGTVLDALTQAESETLAQCEAVIKQGIRTFLEVGDALTWIQKGRLHRATHPTFRAYLEHWGISESHAYRMIDAAKTVHDLSPTGEVLPVNEAQARAVKAAGDTPEERAEVWAEAVEREGGKPASAERVREVANERRGGVNPDGSPNPFAGEADAAAEFMADFRDKKAAGDAPRLDKGTRITKPDGKPGDEFYTPARFIEAARAVMGHIDLDPASCETANKTVQAVRWITQVLDGLAQAPWSAETLWLNPPYSATGEWVAALEASYISGATNEAMLLVNAKTETAWFNTLWDHAVLCFVRGRIAFDVPQEDGSAKPEGNGYATSVVAYFPADGDPGVEAFHEHFGKLGRIVDVRKIADE